MVWERVSRGSWNNHTFQINDHFLVPRNWGCGLLGNLPGISPVRRLCSVMLCDFIVERKRWRWLSNWLKRIKQMVLKMQLNAICIDIASQMSYIILHISQKHVWISEESFLDWIACPSWELILPFHLRGREIRPEAAFSGWSSGNV